MILQRIAHYNDAAAVTPADGTDLTEQCQGLYIGVAGDVTVVMAKNGSTVTYKAVPVGILPIAIARVKQTGTTATNILALYARE